VYSSAGKKRDLARKGRYDHGHQKSLSRENFWELVHEGNADHSTSPTSRKKTIVDQSPSTKKRDDQTTVATEGFKWTAPNEPGDHLLVREHLRVLLRRKKTLSSSPRRRGGENSQTRHVEGRTISFLLGENNLVDPSRLSPIQLKRRRERGFLVEGKKHHHRNDSWACSCDSNSL